MIKNIIFDMGNVLLEFEPHDIMSHFVIKPEYWDILKKEIFGCGEWKMADKGTITDEEMKKRVLSRLPECMHETAVTILAHWHEHMPVVRETEELVKELKQADYKIYLLSNASTRFYVYKSRIPALRYFDGMLISADVKMVKPNRDIYERLFEAFALTPSECLFVDDMQVNIDGAASCGMIGYRYLKDIGGLREFMYSHGVQVKC